MTSRRSPNGWWTRRAEARQNLQLLPPAPRMIGPQPLYPLVKPQLNVLPKPVKHSEPVATPRMEKVTSVERELCKFDGFTMNKGHKHYGYAMKLVKRGMLKIVSQENRETKFAKVFDRASFGSVLSAAAKRQEQLRQERIAGKRGIASQGLAS